ncbi:hypothetical protein OnM2_026086 [Erysiphe neolycopersici]|uniref:Secreted effector protein n=1 Tax=Erysiphe neolycopersici TaxID=212602 RepID=A0A420I0T4_9PEZI|nr:hypothetical protein OnM2_026086 [Erysiphe neolycopersici]
MGRRFISLLFMLFSLASFVSAGFLNGQKTPLVTEQRLDPLGVISSALQCKDYFYHKMLIYATIREACVRLKTGVTVKGECEKSIFKSKNRNQNACKSYPAKFIPARSMSFKSYSRSRDTNLYSYPLLRFGNLYDENSQDPGSDRVVFDGGCNAVGAVTLKSRRFSPLKSRSEVLECKLISTPPKSGFFDIRHKSSTI